MNNGRTARPPFDSLGNAFDYKNLTNGWVHTEDRRMGLKSRKGIGGRPRKGESPLSRWIDANIPGDAKQSPRERFAQLVGVSRTTVDYVCRGVNRPSLKLAGKIEKLTNGEISMRDWVEWD